MIDSKENNKFDLGVKGLSKEYIKFLELKLQNGCSSKNNLKWELWFERADKKY